MDVTSFDDTLALEIPSGQAARRLCELLAGDWAVWIEPEPAVAVVHCQLNSEPVDLAVLMRVVENWVEKESLCAIRYCLDGRDYVLHSGDFAWSSLVAA
jgi:hypothetical protein